MYSIDVVLPEKLITSYKREIPFKQEMRGVVEIVTEDLRLIETFSFISLERSWIIKIIHL